MDTCSFCPASCPSLHNRETDPQVPVDRGDFLPTGSTDSIELIIF
jgi:hypothetical protein